MQWVHESLAMPQLIMGVSQWRADALDLGRVQRVDLWPALTSSSAVLPSILRRISRMMRPSRVRRNFFTDDE